MSHSLDFAAVYLQCRFSGFLVFRCLVFVCFLFCFILFSFFTHTTPLCFLKFGKWERRLDETQVDSSAKSKIETLLFQQRHIVPA